jgi:hypothetical protein
MNGPQPGTLIAQLRDTPLCSAPNLEELREDEYGDLLCGKVLVFLLQCV